MESRIFQSFLIKKGLKLTKERFTVLKEVFSFHGHFEPEQLYFRMRDSGQKVSRASVYRTLNLLIESGLVEMVSRTDKGAIYEHTFGHRHHDHLICDSCGKVIEFYSGKIEKLQKEICRRNNFEGVSHILEIKGYCEKCRKKNR
jgi:Fur family ferric uptake transcriptional regulator